MSLLFCIFMCAFSHVHIHPCTVCVCIWSVCLYRCVPLFLCLPACICVCFPENAAKVRIALVKGHGLVMVHSLQSRAEQTLSCMQKWLEEHYLAEMKRCGTVWVWVHLIVGQVCYWFLFMYLFIGKNVTEHERYPK